MNNDYPAAVPSSAARYYHDSVGVTAVYDEHDNDNDGVVVAVKEEEEADDTAAADNSQYLELYQNHPYYCDYNNNDDNNVNNDNDNADVSAIATAIARPEHTPSSSSYSNFSSSSNTTSNTATAAVLARQQKQVQVAAARQRQQAATAKVMELNSQKIASAMQQQHQHQHQHQQQRGGGGGGGGGGGRVFPNSISSSSSSSSSQFIRSQQLQSQQLLLQQQHQQQQQQQLSRAASNNHRHQIPSQLMLQQPFTMIGGGGGGSVGSSSSSSLNKGMMMTTGNGDAAAAAAADHRRRRGQQALIQQQQQRHQQSLQQQQSLQRFLQSSSPSGTTNNNNNNNFSISSSYNNNNNNNNTTKRLQLQLLQQQQQQQHQSLLLQNNNNTTTNTNTNNDILSIGDRESYQKSIEYNMQVISLQQKIKNIENKLSNIDHDDYNVNHNTINTMNTGTTTTTNPTSTSTSTSNNAEEIRLNETLRSQTQGHIRAEQHRKLLRECERRQVQDEQQKQRRSNEQAIKVEQLQQQQQRERERLLQQSAAAEHERSRVNAAEREQAEEWKCIQDNRAQVHAQARSQQQQQQQQANANRQAHEQLSIPSISLMNNNNNNIIPQQQQQHQQDQVQRQRQREHQQFDALRNRVKELEDKLAQSQQQVQVNNKLQSQSSQQQLQLQLQSLPQAQQQQQQNQQEQQVQQVRSTQDMNPLIPIPNLADLQAQAQAQAMQAQLQAQQQVLQRAHHQQGTARSPAAANNMNMNMNMNNNNMAAQQMAAASAAAAIANGDHQQQMVMRAINDQRNIMVAQAAATQQQQRQLALVAAAAKMGGGNNNMPSAKGVISHNNGPAAHKEALIKNQKRLQAVAFLRSQQQQLRQKQLDGDDDDVPSPLSNSARDIIHRNYNKIKIDKEDTGKEGVPQKVTPEMVGLCLAQMDIEIQNLIHSSRTELKELIKISARNNGSAAVSAAANNPNPIVNAIAANIVANANNIAKIAEAAKANAKIAKTNITQGLQAGSTDMSTVTASYIHATTVLNSNYVASTEFKLIFLRTELYDAKKAALRLCKNLNFLRFLFGDVALLRPLYVSDLTKPEIKFMKSGEMKLLSSRDKILGRRIVFSCDTNATVPLNNYLQSISMSSATSSLFSQESTHTAALLEEEGRVTTATNNQDKACKNCVTILERIRVETYLRYSVMSEDECTQIYGGMSLSFSSTPKDSDAAAGAITIADDNNASAIASSEAISDPGGITAASMCSANGNEAIEVRKNTPLYKKMIECSPIRFLDIEAFIPVDTDIASGSSGRVYENGDASDTDDKVSDDGDDKTEDKTNNNEINTANKLIEVAKFRINGGVWGFSKLGLDVFLKRFGIFLEHIPSNNKMLIKFFKARTSMDKFREKRLSCYSGIVGKVQYYISKEMLLSESSMVALSTTSSLLVPSQTHYCPGSECPQLNCIIFGDRNCFEYPANVEFREYLKRRQCERDEESERVDREWIGVKQREIKLVNAHNQKSFSLRAIPPRKQPSVGEWLENIIDEASKKYLFAIYDKSYGWYSYMDPIDKKNYHHRSELRKRISQSMRDDRKRIRRAAKVTPQTSIATAIRSQKRICTENNKSTEAE